MINRIASNSIIVRQNQVRGIPSKINVMFIKAISLWICSFVLYSPVCADRFVNTGVGTINTCDSTTLVGIGLMYPSSLSGESNLELGNTVTTWGVYEGGELQWSSPDPTYTFGRDAFIDNYLADGIYPQMRFLVGEGNTSYGVLAILDLTSGNFSVGGGLYASSITINSSSGALFNVPDYVFEPGYRPQNLKETDKYIRAHKHLPGMPNAAQLKTEGMNLVDMNLKLLKQVEDLTLHAIEQEKRIQALEQKLQMQRTNQ